MAIKFSQFVVETSAATMSHIVGYNGADNIQITPENFFTSFATGSSTDISYFSGSSILKGDSTTPFVYIDDTSTGGQPVGRMGLGTSSPNFKLDIAGGDLRMESNNGIRFGGIGSNNTYWRIFTTGTSTGSLSIGNSSSTPYLTISRGSSTTGFVGIGTSSPGTTLDVVGTLASSGITQLGTGGSNVLLTSSSAGNVGIGTSSPNYKLHTKGTVNGNVNIAVENDSTGTNAYSSYRFKNDSIDTAVMFLNGSNNTSYAGASSLNMYQGTSLPLGFVTNNLLRMIVAGDGNVGIGTSTPGYSLEVRGNADQSLYLAKTGTTYLRATASANAELFTGGSMVLGSGNAERMRIDSSGNVGIGTTNPAQKLDVVGTLASSGITQLGTSGSNVLLTSASAGKVGIGTTSPSDKLHVYGGSSYDVIARFEATGTGTGDYSEIHIANDNNNRLILGSIGSNYSNSSWAGMRYVYSTVGDLGLKAVASDGNVRIYAGGSAAERMRITSAGNVGIGTSSPTQKLDVRKNQAGYTYIASDNANTAASGTGSGFAMTEGGSVAWYLRNERDGSGKFNIGNSANRLTIDSSGNVGIGTTSPSRDFVVSNGGASGIEIQANYQTGVNEILSFDRTVGATAYETMRFNGGDFQFQIGGTEKMRITSSGNVGIGTTSPVTKLNVVGNVSVSATKAYRMYNAANNAWGEMSFVEADNRIQFNRSIQNSGTDFRLSEDTNASFVCANEGNFGIGTSTPTAKLTVVGLAEHADNSAAISAGLTTGAFYRTGDLLKVVH